MELPVYDRISIFVGQSTCLMIIYSPVITHRLVYIADFIGRELTGEPARVTDRLEEFRAATGVRVNYSPARITTDEFWIAPHTLLFESGIHEQDTGCFMWNNQKAFFSTVGDHVFDLFAAAFFLLSRYEEYLPHEKDGFGRYAHTHSLAYKEDFLDIPLVNTWLQKFRAELQHQFPGATFKQKTFRFLPTYDIDEAWSFKHKQWWRSAGAALKDLLSGRFGRVKQRRRVLNNREPDPFDSYDWIDDLHRPYSLHPRYFFLLAGQTGKYDRNILPTETAMQSLVNRHAEKYETGIHPSWQSGDDPSLIRKEKELLEMITRRKVISSRQHFIRFRLPDTYRHLLEAGLQEDFSMGYGSINGFRASVASPFYWYDLEKEQVTSLLLHPFCFMEANSFFEQRATPEQALEEMRHYHREVKKVNGQLITIWHNTFLGMDPMYAGWKEVYARFVKEVMA